MLAASLEALAADAGARLVQPFLDPLVVGAVAAHFPLGGPGDRTAAMRALFGDLLPDDVLARRSKAWFDEAFFAEHSRRFVAGWDGRGVDPSLVDAEKLAGVWQSQNPDPRSGLLLQAAWLAQTA
jgi:hypothetical protein